MKQPLVSVIVPIYNVEPYLRECLDSILAQTYRHLEIILVDDGATDGCPAICDEYVKKDNRVQVIHQENKGLGPARNTGLDKATGEYIMMPDSDDIVHPKAVEVLLEAIPKEGRVLAMMMGSRSKAVVESCDTENVQVEKLSKEDLITIMFGPSNMRHSSSLSAWNKLYSRELVRDHRFVLRQHGEDSLFNLKLFLQCECAVWVDLPMYYYRPRQGSITQGKAELAALGELKAFRMRLDLFDELNTATNPQVLVRAMKIMLSTRFHCQGSALESDVKQIIAEMKALVWKPFMSHPRISIGQKVVYGALFYCPWLYSIYIDYQEWKARRV